MALAVQTRPTYDAAEMTGDKGRPMRNIYVGIFAAAMLLCGGCAAPEVAIEHRLPAAVPLGVDAFTVTAAKVTGLTDDADALAALAITRSLAEADLLAGATPSGPVAQIAANFTVTTDERRSHRSVREWNAEAESVQPRQADSLVRIVNVSAAFTISRPDHEPVTVQVDRTYDSRSDPNVWGEMGLERPDDPRRVPTATDISADLIGQCAERLAAMLRPLPVRVVVPVRPVGGQEGSAGLAAAADGRFDEALEQFRLAVAERPQDRDLLFDAAVAAEAAGELHDSLGYYQQVVDLSGGEDLVANEGAQRVQRIIERFENP